MAEPIGVFSVTETFDLIRPCVISVNPASSGTVAVQLPAAGGWSTAGTIAAGESKKVNAYPVKIRVLVTGSVTYEVQ
jgi:hypothetical protein